MIERAKQSDRCSYMYRIGILAVCTSVATAIGNTNA